MATQSTSTQSSSSSSSSSSNNTPVVITSIECINHYQAEDDLGYVIKTNQDGYIRVSMDQMQRCCETFGTYVMKNQKNVKKNLKRFVGQEIVSIVVSPLKPDASLNASDDDNDASLNDDDDDDASLNDSLSDDQKRWVEIYLKDDPDPLMLYVYNHHNGYYPHGCSIEWKGQVVPDENL